MRAGQIVDDGRTDDVLTASGVSRYTKQLREDTPSLSKSRAQRGSLREHTTAAAPRYSSDSTRDLSHG
jgi:ABC-type oligopeptide transport system ATPase subunit